MFHFLDYSVCVVYYLLYIHVFFFTDDDLGIVFGLFDLTGKGVMAPKQFANALKNLGIERAPAIERPISKERFVQLARAALDAL